MAGRECYHCRQWVADGNAHDCWTTTEAALTRELSEDLRDAWERLRETAASFGEQRIYASHNSIMFSRRSCYFFVRPKRRYLEVCVFLDRELQAPQVRRAVTASKTRIAHLLHVRHRDEVEAPITDWLLAAYRLQSAPAAPQAASASAAGRAAAAPRRRGATTPRTPVKTSPTRRAPAPVKYGAVAAPRRGRNGARGR